MRSSACPHATGHVIYVIAGGQGILGVHSRAVRVIYIYIYRHTQIYISISIYIYTCVSFHYTFMKYTQSNNILFPCFLMHYNMA